MRKSRKYIMAVAGAALFAIALLAICIGIICQRERGTPLETFSGYLEKLCREGHRSQLEQYVISRRLSLTRRLRWRKASRTWRGMRLPSPISLQSESVFWQRMLMEMGLKT